MAKEGPVIHGLGRTLTLLRLFLVASAVILGLGAIGLSVVLSRSIEHQKVEDEKEDVALYADAVLSPIVVRGEQIVVDRSAQSHLERVLHLPGDVRSVKVWRRDGLLAYATLAPDRIGRTYPLEGQLGKVMTTGEAEGGLEVLHEGGAHEAEEAAEASLLGLDRVLEVYAPIRDSRGRTVGAYEVYVDPVPLEAAIGSITRQVWLAVLVVFVTLYVLLAVLVTNASRRLQSQNAELAQRSRALGESLDHLERSTLEMVEALNATVEAKDPYTAGHSQRVRQIALAIARRLDFSPDELELLAVAALFHDVGKIGIPDAILTKPGPLTEEEFAVMRQHAPLGAEIVGRLSDLAGAVPVIRHHHERWDGRGYPNGLRGEEIPLGAAVVGLADAWDAMTTARPNADARSLTDALTEVVDGRGSQFSPAVVDAFFDVVRQRPADLPHPATATVAVGGW